MIALALGVVLGVVLLTFAPDVFLRFLEIATAFLPPPKVKRGRSYSERARARKAFDQSESGRAIKSARERDLRARFRVKRPYKWDGTGYGGKND
jgi:hypothetical protein